MYKVILQKVPAICTPNYCGYITIWAQPARQAWHAWVLLGPELIPNLPPTVSTALSYYYTF